MADKRTLGVTVICILGFLGALLDIAGGAMIIGLGGLALGAMVAALGAVTLIIGIVLLIAVWWLWNLKKMGWNIVMVLEVIGLIISLVSINYIGIILPLIIVIYLWMKKDLFK